MREIKFRAWYQRKKEMIYDFQDTVDWEVKNNFELMQYTGLKDKNGKDIYEGDILKWTLPKGMGPYGGVSDDTTAISKVDWDDRNLTYILKGVGEDEGYVAYLSEEHGLKRNTLGEVIGNIYENPDLLK